MAEPAGADDDDSILGQLSTQERVVIVGSGGLSHTKISEPLDYRFLKALETNDLEYMGSMPAADLVEGTSEIRNWIVTAGAANRPGKVVKYFPLFLTRTGVAWAMGF